MKMKKTYKRIVSAFLAFAMVAGLLHSGVLTREAEASSVTTTFPVNQRLAVGVGHNLTPSAMYMFSTDVIFFEITVTKHSQAAGHIEFGLANSNGVFVQSSGRVNSSHTNGTMVISHTMRVNQTGTYHIRVRNSGSSGHAEITVRGSAVHVDAIQPPLRIVYCRSATHNTTQIRDNYRLAVAAFAPQFGIVLHQSPTISQSTGMLGHECKLPLTLHCPVDGCANVSSCGDECKPSTGRGHNRGTNSLLGGDISSNSRQYTIRVVAHELCKLSNTNNGIHGVVSGAAKGPNPVSRDSVVTLQSGAVSRTMQHELSHNFGVPGHCNAICVMNVDLFPRRMDVWCVPCRDTIRSNLGRI